MGQIFPLMTYGGGVSFARSKAKGAAWLAANPLNIGTGGLLRAGLTPRTRKLRCDASTCTKSRRIFRGLRPPCRGLTASDSFRLRRREQRLTRSEPGRRAGDEGPPPIRCHHPYRDQPARRRDDCAGHHRQRLPAGPGAGNPDHRPRHHGCRSLHKTARYVETLDATTTDEIVSRVLSVTDPGED